MHTYLLTIKRVHEERKDIAMNFSLKTGSERWKNDTTILLSYRLQTHAYRHLAMWVLSKVQPSSPVLVGCGMSCTHQQSVVNLASRNLRECQSLVLTFTAVSLFPFLFFFLKNQIPLFLWRDRDATSTLTTPCKPAVWRGETERHMVPWVPKVFFFYLKGPVRNS